MKIKEDWLRNSLIVTTSDKKVWEYKFNGVTYQDVHDLGFKIGNKKAIEQLVSEGKLKPVYGGKINLK